MEEDDVSLLAEKPASAASKRRPYVVTAIFTFALLSLVAFSWRVFSFYRAIGRGEVVPAFAYSTDAFTRAGQVVARLAKEAGVVTDIDSFDDPSLGSADARVTIIEFADFGCPYSKEVSFIVRAVAQQFPNDVRYVYRDFPLVDVHPGADLTAEAGECAQEQGKFWEFHDRIYTSDVELTQESMFNIASAIGLNEDAFATCLTSRRFQDEVNTDLQEGAAAGVVGTPTFFFNGVKVEGSIPFSVFNDIVHALLED
ncbi:MAG: DsbA family protein [Candidatus Uhrbacteria bacterium]|nr:DsbA family protein [Candidatus Uhrbacteria bacterium]